MKTTMPKCIANASFYKPKFELLIWWLIIEWVATSWLGDNPYLLVCQKRHWWRLIWTNLNHESSRELSHLYRVKIWIIWTSRTWDMGWTLNSVWAAGQIRTSLLLLQFGLENGLFKSWAPHESCRPMSYLSIHIKWT